MPEEDALWLNSIMERTFNEVRLSELPDRLGEQINNELQTKVNKIVVRVQHGVCRYLTPCPLVAPECAELQRWHQGARV